MKKIFSVLFTILICLILLPYILKKRLYIKSSLFFNCIFPIYIQEGNEITLVDCFFNKSRIVIDGRGNKVAIYGELYNTHIFIYGSNNTLVLDRKCRIHNTSITIRAENSIVSVDKLSTIGGGNIVCMGVNNKIIIGKRCMFSDSIDIWNSDSHPIYSLETEQIINVSKEIIIGDDVWIGKNSAVLKGVHIGNGAICGMKSLVTKDIPEKSLCVGLPAKVIKSNIYWERKYIEV